MMPELAPARRHAPSAGEEMTVTTPSRYRPTSDVAGAAVGYLGRSGHDSFGDDMLFEVMARALPEVRFAQLPVSGVDILRRATRGIAGRTRRSLILGGGTAVGRKDWRAALTAASLSCGAEHHLVGVGVEDPRFRSSVSSGGELARWRSTLRRFSRLTVRGPRSAALLADIGVDADVVGDPALLLCDRVAPAPDGPVGISLGYGDDLWGRNHDRVIDIVRTVAQANVRTGRGVVLLAVDPADRRHADAIAAALPAGSYRIARPRTSDEFFAATARCSVLIAERLHAGILAVGAGLPTVMLEYQPQVRDFMTSVELGAFCVRVDRLSLGALHDLTDRAATDVTAQRRSTAQVERLRRRLSREVAILASAVRDRLDLSSRVPPR